MAIPADETIPLESHSESAIDIPRRGIGIWRGVVISLLLGPICCYWARAQGVDVIFSLMVPPVALTLVLVLINIPLRIYAPRFAFTQSELIVFYAMQTVMCAVSAEWMSTIGPYIHSYGVFQDRNDRYKTHVLPYVSDWLYFKTDADLKDFAVGGKSFAYFLTKIPLWAPKIAAWTVIVGLVCFAFLCINSLMRDQWCNRERLAFPIIQLPVAITQGGGASPFWKSRFMWGGFGVMLFIDTVNGLHYLYPAVPLLNVRFQGDLSKIFASPPWNQIGWTPIGLFPFMAAIGLFMPTDLLFSAVFFFFVRKGQQVAAAALGNEQGVFGVADTT